MRRQRGTKANIATVRWILTYELSAWYEPLLMIDDENEVGVVYGFVNRIVDVDDDDCGWMGESGRWKKVGISS